MPGRGIRSRADDGWGAVRYARRGTGEACYHRLRDSTTCARADARYQASVRSQRYPESGQGAARARSLIMEFKALAVGRLLIAWTTVIAFLMFGDPWLADLDSIMKSASLFTWLLAVIAWCAFGV